MEFHILDIAVWFFGLFIMWFLIDKLSNGEFTNELGAIAGVFILIIYTIFYIIIFGVCDNNISDIASIDIPNITFSW